MTYDTDITSCPEAVFAKCKEIAPSHSTVHEPATSGKRKSFLEASPDAESGRELEACKQLPKYGGVIVDEERTELVLPPAYERDHPRIASPGEVIDARIQVDRTDAAYPFAFSRPTARNCA